MLELKLGDLEEHKQIIKKGYGCWRFVLSKDNYNIFLFAGAIPDGARICFRHNDVVSKYGLSKLNVLGGGEIKYAFGRLIFEGMSGDFGIVPNSIMDNFGKIIFEAFKEKYQIKEIKVDMFYDTKTSKEKNPEHVEMWEKMGYNFDDKKRIISNL